jgi:hypothetical protein
MEGRESGGGRREELALWRGGDKRNTGREIEMVGRRGERGSEDGEGGGGCGVKGLDGREIDVSEGDRCIRGR